MRHFTAPSARFLTLLLSSSLCSLIACADPDEDEELSCAAGTDEQARSCTAATVDLTANALLGSISGDAATGYVFTAEVPENVDTRYGAVYVLNETGAPLRVKLTRVVGQTAQSGLLNHVDRDTDHCDTSLGGYCDRRWLTLFDDTTAVQVEVSDDDGASFDNLGTVELFCDTCNHGTSTKFQDDRENVAANHLQLNCEGVRDFDGDNHPRNFVSILERDAGGIGTIKITNDSQPSTGRAPIWCVYTGVLDSTIDRAMCEEPSTYGDWTWTEEESLDAFSIGSGGAHSCNSALGFPCEIDLGLDDQVDAIAIAERTKSGCPSFDATKTPKDRELIRVVDTTAKRAFFYDLATCTDDGTHVPVAAPFVLTSEATDPSNESFEIELINCSSDTVSLCNSSFGACDPEQSPDYTLTPFTQGSAPASATVTFNNSCNHDMTWFDNGDPTVIVHKKLDKCP